MGHIAGRDVLDFYVDGGNLWLELNNPHWVHFLWAAGHVRRRELDRGNDSRSSQQGISLFSFFLCDHGCFKRALTMNSKLTGHMTHYMASSFVALYTRPCTIPKMSCKWLQSVSPTKAGAVRNVADNRHVIHRMSAMILHF